MTAEEYPVCRSCYGHHAPDGNEIYVVFRGEKITPPFFCLCCGKQICARQFAYGRMCGVCDTGSCQTDPQYYHLEDITMPEVLWEFFKRNPVLDDARRMFGMRWSDYLSKVTEATPPITVATSEILVDGIYRKEKER